jgi:hypothetical protein
LRSTLGLFSGRDRLRGAAAIALGDVLAGADPTEPRASVCTLWRVAKERIGSDGTSEHTSPEELLHDLDSLLEVAEVVAAAGGTIPLSVQAMVARALRAARILCRPNGQPHAFRPAAAGYAAALARLNAMAASAIAVRPDEPSDMFVLPSGGYAGIIAGHEKMIVRFANLSSLRTAHRRLEEHIAIEYCVNGKLALICGLSDTEVTRSIPRQSEGEGHPWRVESHPFVFEGSNRTSSSGTLLSRRVEQLDAGAWRITDRAAGPGHTTCCLYFDADWRLAPTSDSGWLAHHAEGHHAIHLLPLPLAIVSASGHDSARTTEVQCNLSNDPYGSILRFQIPPGGLTWTISLRTVD